VAASATVTGIATAFVFDLLHCLVGELHQKSLFSLLQPTTTREEFVQVKHANHTMSKHNVDGVAKHACPSSW
jgi:hypothetical protein